MLHCRQDGGNCAARFVLPGKAINVTADIADKYDGFTGAFASYAYGKDMNTPLGQAWVMCYPA